MSAPSSLPPQSAFYHAVLRHLAQHPDGDSRENIQEAIPDLVGLTEDQRRERLANRPHLRYRYRSGWALSMLKAAGYVDNPSRGLWRITPQGRQLFDRHPQGFDQAVVRGILQRARLRAPDRPPPVAGESPPQEAEQGPEERIDAALEDIRRAVAQELLEKISSAAPSFFEALVLDLLHALGYGASEEDLHLTGQQGDEGIDGIISLDKLGFEKVYIQAKRWKRPVGRPEVQAFYGALAGRKAKKGVFITTSSFTREAREFSDQLPEKLVLIDGERLTELMMETGVGVAHREFRIPRVDADYFDSG